jgi:cytochrome b561
MPRVVMFFILLLTNWFQQAYQTILWPLLGFFFMPYTTLAYMAAMVNNNHQLSNGWLVLVIIAIVLDLGAHERSARPVYHYRKG